MRSEAISKANGEILKEWGDAKGHNFRYSMSVSDLKIIRRLLEVKKRIVSFVMCALMCCAMCVSAFAADNPVVVPSFQGNKYLGTSDDMESSLSVTDFRESAANVLRGNSPLFRMDVKFKDLVGSNEQDDWKYFTSDDITKGSLKISGVLGSTSSLCKETEVGFALYNAANDTYDSVSRAYFDNNIYSEAYFTFFDINTKYYGYAEKVNSGNYYISGYLEFWDSDEY